MPECVSNANQPKRERKLAAKDLKSLFWPIVLFLLVVAIDQATKFWAVSNLANRGSVHILGDFLMFTLVYNVGGAMGTRFGSSTYYLVIALILLPFIIYYIYRYRNRPILSWPLALIAGGAIGNIIDRLRLGRVVDFIDVDFFNIGFLGLTRWWTFNIADAAITCAIIYLLIVAIFFRRHFDSEEEAVRAGRT